MRWVLILDFEKVSPLDVYQQLISAVSPRPIAWVSSVHESGSVNLAPFSFFNLFGANPPIIVFSPTTKANGGKKDTLANIEATKEFVVHVVTEALAKLANLTSKELPADESEVSLAGLTLHSSVKIKTPRVAESPIAMECKLRQILPFGEGQGSANLVIGEIVAMHIDDQILGENGVIDPGLLQAVGRMGQAFWCKTTSHFELKRE